MTIFKEFFSKVSMLTVASMLVISSPVLNFNIEHTGADQYTTYSIQSSSEMPEARFGLDTKD